MLSSIAVAIAVARANLSSKTLKDAMMAVSIGGVVSLIAALAMVVSAAIVLTGQPSASAPGTQAAPGAQGASGTQTAPGAAAQTGTLGGGPSRTQALVRQFAVGALLMALFVVIELISILRAAPAMRLSPAEASRPLAAVGPDQVREAGLVVVSLLAITAVTLAAIQVMPTPHDNPPVQTAVRWTMPQTQQLWNRACADCHSNETTWPWYTYVAPSSWLTASHVYGGRKALNLSDLSSLTENRKRRLPEDSKEQIEKDLMPPRDYLILHPDARLSEAEKEQLAQGLQETLSKALTDPKVSLP